MSGTLYLIRMSSVTLPSFDDAQALNQLLALAVEPVTDKGDFVPTDAAQFSESVHELTAARRASRSRDAEAAADQRESDTDLFGAFAHRLLTASPAAHIYAEGLDRAGLTLARRLSQETYKASGVGTVTLSAYDAAQIALADLSPTYGDSFELTQNEALIAAAVVARQAGHHHALRLTEEKAARSAPLEQRAAAISARLARSMADEAYLFLHETPQLAGRVATDRTTYRLHFIHGRKGDNGLYVLTGALPGTFKTTIDDFLADPGNFCGEPCHHRLRYAWTVS